MWKRLKELGEWVVPLVEEESAFEDKGEPFPYRDLLDKT